MSDLPEHVAVNRAYWDEQAEAWVASGEEAWASAEPMWGIWRIPERDLPLLPRDMQGMDAIELGCGTGYVSAWMARRGARVLGIDNSERQLATARRLSEQHGVPLELLHGSAETVPRPDQSFDFAISEYGAAIWCDPYVWIPEAHRLLRPGGELVIFQGSTLSALCTPEDGDAVGERLERDYFDLYRLDWRDAAIDPGGVEFALPFDRWLRLFRETGFEVTDFREVRAPAPGSELRYTVTADWARRWPAEQVWNLRRTS